MLNRLYIVVGVIAILILGAAFIVPHFIQWNDYRGRMETLASEALGTRVAIEGDVGFSLLPQPHLSLGKVVVGPVGAPLLAVKAVNADFSLMDFLRDRYSMSKLVLDHPVLNLEIGPGGQLKTGLSLPAPVRRASLSIKRAKIVAGQVKLTDARLGQSATVDALSGDLSLDAVKGPFGFQGAGSLDGARYELHLTSSALDAKGGTKVSFFAKPVSGKFSINAQGSLSTGAAPRLLGSMTFRASPPPSRDPNSAPGDLVLTANLDADTQKIVLSSVALEPDENRAATRLTGSAVVTLGKAPHFTASLAGGALALPPRDALAGNETPHPYELLRLLAQMPVLPLPPLPGKLALNIDALGVRAFTLGDVQVEASTDTRSWTLEGFSADLPGATRIQLAGTATSQMGKPEFNGTLSVASQRLDGLAALWRKPPPGNPLFDMPGTYSANVELAGQTLAFTDGKLTLDGAAHSLEAMIGFGDQPRLDISARFGKLDPAHSAALMALVPQFWTDTEAGVSFPQGAVSLGADTATVLGLSGTDLALEGKWANGTADFTTIKAGELGGAKLDLAATVAGSLAAPKISIDGKFGVTSPDAPALVAVYNQLDTPEGWRGFLARSLPATLTVHLAAPGPQGAQTAVVSGTAGAMTVNMAANFPTGVAGVFSRPVSGTLDLSSTQPDKMTAQLGLGPISLMPGPGPMTLSAVVNGSVVNSLGVEVSVASGKDNIDYDGDLVTSDPETLSGNGKLTATLSDTSVLADAAGLSGLYTPPVTGGAALSFVQGKSVTLDGISGHSGDRKFSGRLALDLSGGAQTASGTLKLDPIDVAGLGEVLGGPTALLASAGKIWPDGPISLGQAPRKGRGDIKLEVPAITGQGRVIATNAVFDVYWTPTGVGLRNFNAGIGGGSVGLNVDVCCAGPQPDKHIKGDVTVSGVAVDALLPPAPAETLSGTLKASGQFSGTADSIAGLMSTLGGDGSFTLSDLTVKKLNPGVFADVAKIEDILDLAPEALTSRVAADLDQAAFKAPKMSGTFVVAGGVVRARNLAAENAAAKLFGGTTLALDALKLGGSFALSPTGTVALKGLVNKTSAQVTAKLSGTLERPQRDLDISTMVDGLKMQAYSVELARLEKLKAEDDARRAAEKKAYDEQQAAERKAAAAAAAAAKKAAEAPATPPLAAPAPQPAAPAPAASAGSGSNSPMDLGIPALPDPN